MAEINIKFSKRLSSEIKKKGWDNQKFAELVEIHPNSATNYLKNGRVPEWDILVRISELVEKSCDYLLLGIEEPAVEVNEAVLPYNKKSLNIADISDLEFINDYKKTIEIKGTEYSVKQLVEMASEVLASDHLNSNSLAYNIVSFIGPVRRDKEEKKLKKNNSDE